MPGDIKPDNLLAHHRDCMVTVWFMPENLKTGADWLPSTQHQGLLEAVKAIIADAGQHSGYDVHIHLPTGADRLLSQSELEALIDFVAAGK